MNTARFLARELAIIAVVLVALSVTPERHWSHPIVAMAYLAYVGVSWWRTRSDWNATEPTSDSAELPTAVVMEAVPEQEDAPAPPSIGENHPAALAFHYFNDVARILRTDVELITDLDLGAGSDLLDGGVAQVAKLYQLLQRQERTIEEQRVECLTAKAKAERETAYATRVEEKNSELAQAVISLTRQLEDAHVLIAEIRGGALTNTEPRIAAAGGR